MGSSVKYVSAEAKMHRNAAMGLKSVKTLSTSDLNHKLLKMSSSLFSFSGVLCKIIPLEELFYFFETFL